MLLTFSAYLLRHPILRSVGAAITHEDPLEAADAIVVLSGDEATRPFRAAALYREGWAPMVALPFEELPPTAQLGLVPTSTSVALQVLLDSGVPADSIVVLSRDQPVTSTRDEATAVRTLVAERGLSRLIIVTSPFHTARARYTFRKALPSDVDIRMSAAREWQYDTERWWESETGIADYGIELLKWVHTLGVLN